MPIASVSGMHYKKVFSRGSEMEPAAESFNRFIPFRSEADKLERITKTGWCRAYQHYIRKGNEAYKLGENAFVCINHYPNLPTLNMVREGNLHSWSAPQNIISIDKVEIVAGFPSR